MKWLLRIANIARLKERTFRYVFSVCYLVIASAHSQPGPSKEDQIKAAYIFNFAKFTAWPESRFATPESPFIIGILGTDPFGVFLDEIVKGENVQGHPIIVRRYKTFADIEACHLLYINKNMSTQLSKILNHSKEENLLTISDMSEFTTKGGIVKLYNENQKIRFEVNLGEAKDTNLVLSSRLLRLASICCERNN